MRTDVVLTLTGPDRVGIVEEVTRILLDAHGSVGTSRMVRLGGEFAILMHVSLSSTAADTFEPTFAELASQGYHITISELRCKTAPTQLRSKPYRIQVVGADHEGIVYEIVRGLARCGINIESMETETSEAPVSGITLFSISAVVSVPPDLAESAWRTELDEAAELASVEVEVEAL